jgi:hypothetical protein
MITISRGRLALVCASAFTDAEHSAAAKAVAALKQGSQVFSIDPAGGCKLKNVDLSSAALGLGQPSFYRDEGDNAWWSHASTPGVR